MLCKDMRRGRATGRLVWASGKNITVTGVPDRWRRYLSDFYTTLIDIKWRWNLLFFVMCFVFTWLAFACFYFLQCALHGDLDPGHVNDEEWKPCVVNVNSFTSAYLFSIETMSTIGYGSRQQTEECPGVYLAVMLQSVIGAGLQFALASLVVSKTRRAKRRSETILFSDTAVTFHEDGKLKLAVRIGDMRKGDVIGAHATGMLIKKTTGKQGQKVPVRMFTVMFDAEGGREKLFLYWPSLLVHVVDEHSPLWSLSRDDLLNQMYELIVIVDGIAATTSKPFQARKSYHSWEILWGHRFAPLDMKEDNTGYVVNYQTFHDTYPVAIPLCSAMEVEREYFLEELRHQESVFSEDTDNEGEHGGDDSDDWEDDEEESEVDEEGERLVRDADGEIKKSREKNKEDKVSDSNAEKDKNDQVDEDKEKTDETPTELEDSNADRTARLRSQTSKVDSPDNGISSKERAEEVAEVETEENSMDKYSESIAEQDTSDDMELCSPMSDEVFIINNSVGDNVETQLTEEEPQDGDNEEKTKKMLEPTSQDDSDVHKKKMRTNSKEESQVTTESKESREKHVSQLQVGKESLPTAEELPKSESLCRRSSSKRGNSEKLVRKTSKEERTDRRSPSRERIRRPLRLEFCDRSEDHKERVRKMSREELRDKRSNSRERVIKTSKRESLDRRGNSKERPSKTSSAERQDGNTEKVRKTSRVEFVESHEVSKSQRTSGKECRDRRNSSGERVRRTPIDELPDRRSSKERVRRTPSSETPDSRSNSRERVRKVSRQDSCKSNTRERVRKTSRQESQDSRSNSMEGVRKTSRVEFQDGCRTSREGVRKTSRIEFQAPISPTGKTPQRRISLGDALNIYRHRRSVTDTYLGTEISDDSENNEESAVILSIVSQQSRDKHPDVRDVFKLRRKSVTQELLFGSRDEDVDHRSSAGDVRQFRHSHTQTQKK